MDEVHRGVVVDAILHPDVGLARGDGRLAKRVHDLVAVIVEVLRRGHAHRAGLGAALGRDGLLDVVVGNRAVGDELAHDVPVLGDQAVVVVAHAVALKDARGASLVLQRVLERLEGALALGVDDVAALGRDLRHVEGIGRDRVVRALALDRDLGGVVGLAVDGRDVGSQDVVARLRLLVVAAQVVGRGLALGHRGVLKHRIHADEADLVLVVFRPVAAAAVGVLKVLRSRERHGAVGDVLGVVDHDGALANHDVVGLVRVEALGDVGRLVGVADEVGHVALGLGRPVSVRGRDFDVFALVEDVVGHAVRKAAVDVGALIGRARERVVRLAGLRLGVGHLGRDIAHAIDIDVVDRANLKALAHVRMVEAVGRARAVRDLTGVVDRVAHGQAVGGRDLDVAVRLVPGVVRDVRDEARVDVGLFVAARLGPGVVRLAGHRARMDHAQLAIDALHVIDGMVVVRHVGVILKDAVGVVEAHAVVASDLADRQVFEGVGQLVFRGGAVEDVVGDDLPVPIAVLAGRVVVGIELAARVEARVVHLGRHPAEARQLVVRLVNRLGGDEAHERQRHGVGGLAHPDLLDRVVDEGDVGELGRRGVVEAHRAVVVLLADRGMEVGRAGCVVVVPHGRVEVSLKVVFHRDLGVDRTGVVGEVLRELRGLIRANLVGCVDEAALHAAGSALGRAVAR